MFIKSNKILFFIKMNFLDLLILLYTLRRIFSLYIYIYIYINNIYIYIYIYINKKQN